MANDKEVKASLSPNDIHVNPDGSVKISNADVAAKLKTAIEKAKTPGGPAPAVGPLGIRVDA